MKEEYLNIKIIDLTGREVATIINERKGKGTHTTGYNASKLSPGIYIVRLQCSSNISTVKFIKE